MEFENILKLIDSVSNSGLSVFSLEQGDTKLVLETVRKPSAQEIAMANEHAGDITENRASGNAQANIPENASDKSSDGLSEDDGVIVKSPLVGIFYNAPSPDDKPYVSVGDHVKKGQVIGIIEAMKLMNEIEAEADGVVTKIYLENGQTAEYGEPVICIGRE